MTSQTSEASASAAASCREAILAELLEPTSSPQDEQACLWACARCQHQWRSSYSDRLTGRSICKKCPKPRYARGSKIGNTPGLAYLLEDVVSNLTDPSKRVDDLTPGSDHRCQWKCTKKPGDHPNWEATVGNRALRRSGCPECKKASVGVALKTPKPGQSLGDLHPELSLSLLAVVDHPDLGAYQVKPGSEIKGVWRCAVKPDAHPDWEASIESRARLGSGCPRCGDVSGWEKRQKPLPGRALKDTHPTLAAEFVRVAGRPDLGIEDLSGGSGHRCLWKCVEPESTHAEWEATVSDRVGGNGCPRCGVRKNVLAAALSGKGFKTSLLEGRPDLGRQFLRNLDYPELDAAHTALTSDQVCEWKCRCARVFQSTVESRTSRSTSGCDRCSRRQRQSLLEYQVAALLARHTGLVVEHDVALLLADGSKALLDLFLPTVGIYVDLDPRYYHLDQERDERKSQRMKGTPYLRVRQEGLSQLPGEIRWVKGGSAQSFAEGLRSPLTSAGLVWEELSAEETINVLKAAAKRWCELTEEAPTVSLATERPELLPEYVENKTRPGLGPEWISPGSQDRIQWKCTMCQREWVTPAHSRGIAGHGCSACSSTKRALPETGQSLQDVYPAIAAEFVASKRRPEATPLTLRPRSAVLCEWRCGTCGATFYQAVYARTRTGKPGCRTCAKKTQQPS